MGSFGSSLAFARISALIALGLAAGCGLSGAVDDVVQSPDDPSAGATGAGGASTSTSNGAGAGSTSNGAGGSTGNENCTDGIDNDGDGMTDCADSDCTPGFECVDAPPKDGVGLYRVDKGAPDAKATCADGSAAESYLADPAGPAECTACTCGDPAGATCKPASITCYPGSQSCTVVQGQDWTAMLNAGACNKPPLGGSAFSLSCLISAPAAVGEPGKCEGSTTDFPNKQPWASGVAACAVPSVGGGCGDAKACVPKAPAGSPQSVCIKLDGTQKCPAGFETVVPAFTGGTDTRGCSPCQCGDPKIDCAGGAYTFYDLDNCVMGGAGTDAPINIASNMCTNVSALLDSGSYSSAPVAATPTGSCAPSGGEPTGELKGDNPVTFCCQ